MIDTDKYTGHTEGPWSIRSPVSQVTKKYRGNNEGKVGLSMSDWPSYGVAGVGPCSIRRRMNDRKSEETWHANIHLIADAPLLLEEVMRLHEGIEKLANSMEISANKGKNRMSWPTRLLWVDALKELIENTKGRTSEVKRLQERVKDLEYEVEHWQGELRSRMHPIDYDALVNGGEEE